MKSRAIVACSLPADAHATLLAYAAREDRSLSQVIRWAIQDWLVKHTPWRPGEKRERATVMPAGSRRKRPLAPLTRETIATN